MALQYRPSVRWDPQVHAYLESAFGGPRLHHISEALCRPSLHTCLRVNTLQTTPQEVVRQLQQLRPSSQPYVHPAVKSAVILPGRGPLPLDLQACGGAEVIINRLAGEAVLQGAHVYAPGLLAASPGLSAGDLVAVTVAVEQQGSRWCGINRGTTLTPALSAQLPGRQQLCVGVGRVLSGRRELFRQQQGLAVEMVQRVFDVQPCNGLLEGQVMLQSLPCIVAAQVLDPRSGSRVLDMCAAPGGKTSMLAQMMAGNTSSRLVALDRTAAKVARVQQLSQVWGVQHIVEALPADVTQVYQQQQQHRCWDGQLDLQDSEPLGDSCSQPAAAGTASCSTQSVTSQDRSSGRDMCSAGSSSSSSRSSDTSSSSSSSSSGSSSSRRAAKRRRLGPSQPEPLSPQVLAAVQAESFDAVLLDAPCSALGLRPRLLLDWTLPRLQALAAYQRALLHSAVHVLKPGGSLVWCTCTINPGENEGNVRYVLDKWSQMQLVQQPLVLGGPGLTGPGWLHAKEAVLVQRFDPGSNGSDDTIGFFIAKFVKKDGTVTKLV